MASSLTRARTLKSPANKTRLLLYGSAALALVGIHLWKHNGFMTREDISSSYRTKQRRSSGRSRVSLDIQHAASSEILDTAASVGALTECCGDVSASCRPIPASNHLLVFVSVPNVASGTARRFPLRKQWHKSLVLMEERMKKMDSYANATAATGAGAG